MIRLRLQEQTSPRVVFRKVQIRLGKDKYARMSHELGGAKTFLAIDDADNETIPGFYSLSPPRLGMPARRRSYGAGWLAMTYRLTYGFKAGLNGSLSV